MDNQYKGVVDEIQKLSEEQHRLYLLASKRELSDAQRRRLVVIKKELQELWLNRKQERPQFRDPLNALVEQWHGKAV
ncbi:MAG: hypothetical protein ABI874_06840 [Chloroflexota bacterium]